jgi:thymidylate synthase (FAD)
MHSAKLVWITPNAEALIGKIARVSNPSNEENPEVEKLIKYLIKHKHWSPFEMASMCVQIDTTRAISPQILRHRSFTFQEFSQRYAIPY